MKKIINLIYFLIAIQLAHAQFHHHHIECNDSSSKKYKSEKTLFYRLNNLILGISIGIR